MTLSSKEYILIIAALAVPILFCAAIYATFGETWFLTGDSDNYWLIAQNVYEHGVFSISTSPPYLPTALTTPLYPLFLVAVGIPLGTAALAIALQIMLFAATAVLFYRTTKEWFSERVAFWGAFLLAVEPWNAFSVIFTITQGPFLFLTVLSMWCLARAFERKSIAYFFTSGLSLGAMAMMRPIAAYLPALVALGVVLACWKVERLRTSLAYVGVMLAAFLLMCTPWLIRNYNQFGVFALASKGPYTVYFYSIAELLKHRDGMNAQEANNSLYARAKEVTGVSTQEDLINPKYSTALNTLSLQYIIESPILFTKIYAISLLTFFLSDGYRAILQYFHLLAPVPSLSLLLSGGNIGAIFSYLFSAPLTAIAFLIGATFWGLMTVGSFAAVPIAFWCDRNRTRRFIVYALAAVMLYFAILTGPAAQPPYRVQVALFMFLLAAYSADTLARRLSGPIDFRDRYWYYYRDLQQLLDFVIPKKASLLEIKSGGGAPLLEVHRPAIGSKYDYIVMIDSINTLKDIGATLDRAHDQLHARGRLVITYHNYLWEPLFALCETLGIKKTTSAQNWLSPRDVQNLLRLSRFEVIRKSRRLLFPLYIPLVSALLNAFGRLPLVNALCVTQYVIARPEPNAREALSVSIIVPARNERGNIEEIIKRTPRFGTDQEIIFIEGHSRDGTWEEIKRVAEAYRAERSISFAQQTGMGKGDAVRLGFSMAKHDLLMILDADMTVAPEDLVKFYEAAARNKADFINGSRLVYPMEKQAMRFLNSIANKCFAILFTWLLDQPIKDTLCGTKVLRKSDYERIAENRAYFGDFDPFGDYDLIFGAVKQNLMIIDVPIRYRERVYGTTQIQRWRHGWLLLKMCIFAARKIKFT